MGYVTPRLLDLKRLEYAEKVGHLSADEFTVIAHLRQWCHDSTTCRMCQETAGAIDYWKAQGRKEAVTEIASGRTDCHECNIRRKWSPSHNITHQSPQRSSLTNREKDT